MRFIILHELIFGDDGNVINKSEVLCNVGQIREVSFFRGHSTVFCLGEDKYTFISETPSEVKALIDGPL